MALEHLSGETGKNMKVSGWTESKTAEVPHILFFILANLSNLNIGAIILPQGDKKEGIWEDGKRIKWITEEWR